MVTTSPPGKAEPAHDAAGRFARAMSEMPLVAILRGIAPDEAVPVAEALVEAGFRLIEVPLNSPRAFDSIERLAAWCPPDVLIGAGTVLWPEQVGQLVACGAQLMVTPNTDPQVVAAGARAGLVTVIGCLTPSEAFTALRHGAWALKIFPAARLGPAYLKDLRAVLPEDTLLLPVGGIDVGNMAPYHTAGAAGFGFGTGLYVPGRTPEAVGAAARGFVAEMRRLRTGA